MRARFIILSLTHSSENQREPRSPPQTTRTQILQRPGPEPLRPAAEQRQGSEVEWELCSWQLRRGLTGSEGNTNRPGSDLHPSGTVGVKDDI